LKQVRQSGLPCYIFDEKNQTGSNFGEKLANAFSEVFEKGFDQVIVVGNDTPNLQCRHIIEADAKLTHHNQDIVIGPASDGGTWLMGFSRKAFVPQIFGFLSWNSKDLLSSIYKTYQKYHSVFLFSELDDVDNYEDLLKFLKIIPGYKSLLNLRRIILSILTIRESDFRYPDLFMISNLYHTSLSLRAPPVHV
jgi:glycosyltransferase A (GT-A) superfamily protein (DUF2064 family)